MSEINKYTNGKIYSIRSHKTDKFYIGSTITTLIKRLHKHRSAYKRFINNIDDNKLSSFEIIKHDDNYIELLENFSCNNREELNKREGEFIRLHKNNIVNIQIAGQDRNEWLEKNKDKLKEQQKKYNETYIRVITDEQKKKYNEAKNIKVSEKYKCICGLEIRKDSKSRHEKRKIHLSFITRENKE